MRLDRRLQGRASRPLEPNHSEGRGQVLSGLSLLGDNHENGPRDSPRCLSHHDGHPLPAVDPHASHRLWVNGCSGREHESHSERGRTQLCPPCGQKRPEGRRHNRLPLQRNPNNSPHHCGGRKRSPHKGRRRRSDRRSPDDSFRKYRRETLVRDPGYRGLLAISFQRQPTRASGSNGWSTFGRPEMVCHHWQGRSLCHHDLEESQANAYRKKRSSETLPPVNEWGR